MVTVTAEAGNSEISRPIAQPAGAVVNLHQQNISLRCPSENCNHILMLTYPPFSYNIHTVFLEAPWRSLNTRSDLPLMPLQTHVKQCKEGLITAGVKNPQSVVQEHHFVCHWLYESST